MKSNNYEEFCELEIKFYFVPTNSNLSKIITIPPNQFSFDSISRFRKYHFNLNHNFTVTSVYLSVYMFVSHPSARVFSYYQLQTYCRRSTVQDKVEISIINFITTPQGLYQSSCVVTLDHLGSTSTAGTFKKVHYNCIGATV